MTADALTKAVTTGGACRVSFRREGDMVNAYMTPPTTLEGAVLLASMRATLLDHAPPAWPEFRKVVYTAFAVLVQNVTGTAPEFTEERPAPEHERAGRA